MSKRALVIIDVQNGLLTGPNAVQEVPRLLANIGALIARARAGGVPIFYVQDNDVGEVGSEAWEVHPAIGPTSSDERVRKPACDAFFETDLDARLRARGIEHLVIAGCKTEFCVDTTCRRAATLRYNVTLAADAHATSDSPVLKAKDIVAHHNQLLDGFGVMIDGLPYGTYVVPSAQIEL